MFIGYILLSCMVALLLSRKNEHKIIAFAVSLRILAEPIIRSFLQVEFPGLPFNLQPDRILFLIFIFLIIYMFFKKKQIVKIDSPIYEKIIWLFLIFVILSIIYNRHRIPIKEALSTPIEIIAFIVFYQGMKYLYTDRLFDTVMLAILILAVANSLIAVLQIIAMPELLKVAEPRIAFGSLWRASGIFATEYQLGYIINIAIAYTLLAPYPKGFKVMLLCFLITGLFTTFHRLNWIICFCVVVTYLFLMKRYARISVLITMATIVILIFSLLLYPNLKKGTHKNTKDNLTTGRLLRDTVTGRLEQYKIALRYTLNNYWGVGSYENREYFKLMSKYKMLESPDEPLGIHNGYLAVGVLYGPLAAFFFTLYIISLLKYFFAKSIYTKPLTCLPFLSVLIWCVANISNRANDFRTYTVVLFSIIFGLSTAMLSQSKGRNIKDASDTLNSR